MKFSDYRRVSSGVATLAAKSSGGTTYSAARIVLSSAGASFTVTNAVLTSAGASFSVV